MVFENLNKKSIFEQARSYGALFRNGSFCMLWLAQIFSQFADRIIFVVFVSIIALNFDTKGSSTGLQSWLYVSFTIPAILLTAMAGIFIDRWNKKWVMIITNLLRGLIILLLPFLDHTLIQLYILAFVMSSVTQFFVPAEAAIIPSVANKYQLLTANSLFATTMMASLIFGFALGDPLINLFGIESVHYAIAALFFGAALCLAFMKYQRKKVVRTANFYNEFKEGLLYIKQEPVIRSSMLKLAALFSVVVMMSILAIALSQKYLYPTNPALGAQKFAYIVVYSGIGMVLGAFLVGNIFRKVEKHLLVYWGIAICGISLFLFALLPFIPQEKLYRVFTLPMIYSYFAALVMGISTAFVAIPTQTILHTEISPDVRGKVFGILFTMLSTASALPVLIAAWGAEQIGVAKVILIISLPILAFGIYKLAVYKRRYQG